MFERCYINKFGFDAVDKSTFLSGFPPLVTLKQALFQNKSAAKI